MKISLDMPPETSSWVFNAVGFLEVLVREDGPHAPIAKQLLYDFENEIKSQLKIKTSVDLA